MRAVTRKNAVYLVHDMCCLGGRVYPLSWSWLGEGGTRVLVPEWGTPEEDLELEAGVPPPPNDLGPETGVPPLWTDLQTPVRTLPSRRTMYAGGNN